MYLVFLTIFGTVAATLVALAGLLRNSRSPVHWWLAGFIVSACAWISIGNLQVFLPEGIILLAMKITFVASVFVGFCMLYFAKAITARSTPKWLRIADWTAVTGLIGLCLSNAVVYEILSISANSLRPARGWGYPVVLAFILLFIVRGLAILAREFIKSRGRKRAQLRIILTGLTIGTLLAVITNVVLPNVTGDTSTSRFAFLAVVVWTALLVYAVVQYRFLDIRLAIVRTLAYIAALVSVMALYVVFVAFVLSALLTENYTLEIYDIVIAALVATTFQPLRSFFDRMTKRIFYRNAYDSQKVFDEISSLFVHISDPADLSQSTLERLSAAVRPRFASIIIVRGKSNKETRIIRHGQGSEAEASLAALFQKQKGNIFLEDDLTGKANSVSRQMRKADVAVSIRLSAGKNTIGYMFLGQKSSGGAFTKQDIELIRIVSDGLAIAIQNGLRFEEIKNFSNTMQAKVEEATKELRATNAQLQRLDIAKDEFVSMASHQLRTPLTSVKGYISMVLEGDVGKITATQRQLLGEAFTSSERMVHLINDFLNVSRLQTGKFMLERKAADLSKIVAEEVDSLQTTAQMHDLKLLFRAPSYFPVLYIDEAKIRQVIMNFIDNAIYYSPEETEITIELSLEDGHAILQVRDTGIGVPKSEQEHLFGKFFRATNARKQRPDGTGVGLFLAKKVVVAHGGTIVFHSEEGKGSTFGFRLPIKKLSRVPDDAEELEK